ncbi:LptF/LptG family permease [Halonatronum saccharophilum]|uniref:LptF/LptG family permease n=1 Tax=Halonatronum saccharophilum TaxID=150060 RepID=UPI0004870662|nr:LptF/LptG family permease [Halonatronum saccharophilum]
MRRIGFSIVDKYLVKEFLKPFIFAVFTLTVIMISSHLFELMDFIIVKNVAADRVLLLLIYKLPDIIVQSFSIAVLFSILLSMTQLVKNREFTALRMGGIGLHRLIIPYLIIGILISGLTFFINERVVPWTNHEAENIIRRIILERGFPNLQAGVFFEGEDRYFYINEIDNRSGALKGVMLYEYEEESSFPRFIKAKEGYFEDKIWHLNDGVIHTFDDDGKLLGQSNFQELELDLNQSLRNFYGEQRTTSEMSRKQLKRDIELFQRSGLRVSSLLVEYHLKLAQAFISLIFILIGAPLSIKSNRGRSFGIVASIIVILIYYVATSFSTSMGRNDLLSPLVAAWLPNIIFAIGGLYLILREEYFKLRR